MAERYFLNQICALAMNAFVIGSGTDFMIYLREKATAMEVVANGL